MFKNPFVNILCWFLILWLFSLTGYTRWDTTRAFQMPIILGLVSSYYGLYFRIMILRKSHFPEKQFFSSIQSASIEIDEQPQVLFDYLKNQLLAQKWKIVDLNEPCYNLEFKVRPKLSMFSNHVSIRISSISETRLKVQMGSEPSLLFLDLILFDNFKNMKNVKIVENLIRQLETKLS